MKIASWNVNSLNVRLPHLLQWLAQAQPDVVALQETKTEDGKFPDTALAEAGYRSVFSGQKTYNGVALLSRVGALEDVQAGIPGFADDQKRALAATVAGVRIVDLYVVNGQAVGSEKYDYKLRWLDAVHGWLHEEITRHPRLVVLGDFNIAPDDRDVHDPQLWNDESILTSTAERAALRRLLALGLHDSFRLLHDDGGQFSWWDYRQAAFRRNLGLRIDLLLVSEAMRAGCKQAWIDRTPRGWERASDHTPVLVELDCD
ncbi:MAG: exodeoxyribonuclease III [Proteobacteria bacterium]|nr:exodeoxyribonuclease III [Pseudomonadota bacterium]